MGRNTPQLNTDQLLEKYGNKVEAIIHQAGGWIATEANAEADYEPVHTGKGETPREALVNLLEKIV